MTDRFPRIPLKGIRGAHFGHNCLSFINNVPFCDNLQVSKSATVQQNTGIC